jgi:hypothetical protein
MSTIGSSISAAAQCGLEMNEAIRAYNENELAQIKLNAAANKAANSLTMSSADATLIAGLANASHMRSSAFGTLAGAVASGTAGFGLMGMENSYSKAGKIAAQNSDPNSMKVQVTELSSKSPSSVANLEDIELPEISKKPSGAAGSVIGNNPKEKSDGVNNDNNKKFDNKSDVFTQEEYDVNAKPAAKANDTEGTKALKERVKGSEEIEANNKELRMKTIGQFLPAALQSMGTSSGSIAAAQDLENKAKADAFAAAAGGIEKLLEANASTATQSQQSAQSLKETLIKAQAEMIMANRA